jgi:hypothetical protein
LFWEKGGSAKSAQLRTWSLRAIPKKIDGLQRSLDTHMKTQTWVISIIGFTIAALTAVGTLVSILRHSPRRGFGPLFCSPPA